jgi:UDP-N-acetylmuramoyl-tripeptide--D-alanyl-D-alanine ligase
MRYPWRQHCPRLVQWATLAINAIAYIWRRLLWRTTVIAITGSVGKTTAKELLGRMLQSRFPTFMTFDTDNGDLGIPRSVLKVRPWHRFAVIEVGMGCAHSVARKAAMLKPDAAIVLAVEAVHINVLGSLEGIRKEKAAMAKAVTPAGWVVLNGEDPNVRSMAAECCAPAILYGSGDAAAWRAEDVSAHWPSRLSFRLTRDGSSWFVQTRLVGDHWISPLLAAVTAADRCGVPVESAIRVMEEMTPYRARMEPFELPGGAWVLRDEYNSSHVTWQAALRCLKEAEAVRRWLVLSNVADIAVGSQQRARMLAKEAISAADNILLIGMHARQFQRHIRIQGFPLDRMHVFSSWREAAAWLASVCRKGDLMLIRGYTSDHLSRIFYALHGPVACSKETCERLCLCDLCRDLYGDKLQPPEGLRDYYNPIYY